MSGIWGWFGNGAAQKRKDTPKNVILDLRTQLDMLQKRETHLNRQIEEQEQIARKNVSTNKTGTVISRMPLQILCSAIKMLTPCLIAAKAALKRKKVREHDLEQTMSHIGTIEQQINAIESANINQETFMAMKRAGVAMKHIHGKLKPEEVDKTMYVLHFNSRPGPGCVCLNRY